MTVSIFEGCSDWCGWIAAAVAAICYGSYGVPVKECSKIDVDPLVMQSYKTIVIFLASFFVVFLGEEIQFTSWGLLSGLLYVPGGTAGIPAIKYAGMAVACGTWASVIVMMNFFWGILVFQEGIKSLSGTSCAFLLLIIGLIGMSIFSDTPSSTAPEEDVEMKALVSSPTVSRKPDLRKRASDVEEATSDTHSLSDGEDSYTAEKDPASKARDRAFFCGGRISLTWRQIGVLGAVLNGAMGGCYLVPMHYAGLKGAAFMVSFATGSLLVNALMWVMLFLYRLNQAHGSVSQAIRALPSWHLRKLWFPGFMSGLLVAIGMFGSILAITYLGQGVGNSFVENQIIVSGLWGIFYYKEISHRSVIVKWLASAATTVCGILWLSYEHESDRGHLHH